MKGNKYELKNDYVSIEDNIIIYLDKINKRIKIMEYAYISTEVLEKIIYFSKEQYMEKIICNCKKKDLQNFYNMDFEMEGRIKGFFKGEDALCMSYFITKNRGMSKDLDLEDEIIKKCIQVNKNYGGKTDNFQFSIRNANTNDLSEIVQLFKTVFSTYPSPVDDEEYLKMTMNGKVLYKVALSQGKIIGIASADMDTLNLNAEITDCAIYPEYRGNGILTSIIESLESELKNMGFITLYSLSRATIPAINMVLSKQNYEYSGRLINNCNMCSSFEDMNIWVKIICNKN